MDTLQGRQRFDGSAILDLDHTQIVEGLKVQPELRGGAEEVAEAQGRVRGEIPIALEDLGDAVGWDFDLARQFCGTHRERFEFFLQMFAGMNCSDGHGLLLVIVDDLNVRRAGLASGPGEADAPLIVDADAVFAGAVALQCFEAVAWECGQICERDSGFKAVKFEASGAFEAGEGFDPLSCVELRGLLVAKTADHG